MRFTKGITKCYKLYPITVLSHRKAAYTLFMGKLSTSPMNVLRKAISIAVLLTAGMACLLNPAQAGQGRDERDAARAERQQFRQNEGRQANANRQDQGGQGVDPGRHGRMTPEERRALRRQINEAGQDIYVPRR